MFFVPALLGRGSEQRACALGLLLALLVLVPLAYARPIDPLWIAGLYDGADLDEVEVVATEMFARAVTDDIRPALGKPVLSVEETIPLPSETPLPIAPLFSLDVRAPPRTNALESQ